MLAAAIGFPPYPIRQNRAVIRVWSMARFYFDV